jgi:cation transport ATPase
VDPLRAARVAHIGGHFRYFCSPECRSGFHAEAHTSPLPLPRRTPTSRALDPRIRSDFLTPVPSVPGGAVTREVPRDAGTRLATPYPAVPSEARRSDFGDAASADPSASPQDALGSREDAASTVPTTVELPSQTDVGLLLLGLAVIGGLLSVILALAGNLGAVLNARLVAAIVGAAALITHHLTARRDPNEPSRIIVLVAPVAALALAIGVRLTGSEHASGTVNLAGIVTVLVAGTAWLVQRSHASLEAERQLIAAALDVPGDRVVGDDVVETDARELRPGEEIVIGPDGVVPVDATVSAGSGRVLPWLGATTPVLRSEGDPLVAGARVVEGRLRAVVGWTGLDRSWMRLTHDVRRRADLLAGLARAGRLAAERGGPVAAGLAALTAFASAHDPVEIAMAAIAAQATLAHAGIGRIGAFHVGRTVLAALRRGIVFRTADALDRAGRVTNAVFCARGTLLLGEPEVANIEPIPPHDAESVLAWVAGAESGASHPVASAVLRAARSRGVRPDGVRSPSHQPGLGVTAVASNGQALVVGSRALMLKERISVARAETKVTELEALGRTVMLVALGSKLVGVIGLQDGLRPGARAAVQYLLDVNVEPVLVSGDARETCEALGRALDVEHVRPEVLPAERGEEVRRMAEGGAIVAVMGRTATDEAALSAADVAVSLGSAGSSSAEWSVELASDDVRDAANAVRLAHRCRNEARLGLVLTLGPAVCGVLAVAFGLFAPALAPVLAFAGTLGALLRGRVLEQ